MICSMTAFARADRHLEGYSLVWEIKAVNHRVGQGDAREVKLARGNDVGADPAPSANNHQPIVTRERQPCDRGQRRAQLQRGL